MSGLRSDNRDLLEPRSEDFESVGLRSGDFELDLDLSADLGFLAGIGMISSSCEEKR